MSEPVRIMRELLERMLAEARRSPRAECCGLLAGRNGVMTAIFPAANALASDTAFEIAPAELFRLFREMRAAGFEHLGIYHSHPAGPNVPSTRDIENAFYPDAVYFILSPLPDAPQPVRAFHIRDGAATELEIKEEI